MKIEYRKGLSVGLYVIRNGKWFFHRGTRARFIKTFPGGDGKKLTKKQAAKMFPKVAKHRLFNQPK